MSVSNTVPSNLNAILPIRVYSAQICAGAAIGGDSQSVIERSEALEGVLVPSNRDSEYCSIGQ